MPGPKDKKLQKFVFSLIAKPQALEKIRANPGNFIGKSKLLSATHKKILLSADPKKIKDAINSAMGGVTLKPIAGRSAIGDAKAAFVIHIHGDKAVKLATSPTAELFPFHIVIGAEQKPVKVSLKKKAAKMNKETEPGSQVLEAFAIHIKPDKGPA